MKERDADFGLFIGHFQGPPWCLATLGWSKPTACDPLADFISGTKLIREVKLSGANPVTAEVKIYWSDSGGTHEVKSVTYFTDWRER